MQPVLVDTCVAIWLTEDAPLGRPAWDMLARVAVEGKAIYVSPITAWEVGMLTSRKRITLSGSPQQWFGHLIARPGIQLAVLSPGILIAASFLPGTPPNDPADRIIAATARDLDATLMTRDRLLLDYATQGHLRAIAC